MDSPKYSQFDASKTSYKTVKGHDIAAYVLVPKNVKSSEKHPVLVRFHGGNLILGAALFPTWFPQYFLNYAIQHSAVIVSPNYRLLPEASGSEILEDVTDFWTWLHQTLPSYLSQNNISVDLDHVACAGESAGGYLAIQSALRQPKGQIKAVIPTCPMIDFRSDWFSKHFVKNFLGVPQIPVSMWESHIAAMKPDDHVTEAYPPARQPISASAVQQGRYPEILGTNEELYPLEVLEKRKVEDGLPFLFIMHATGDSVVPVEGTEKFVELVREKYGEGKAELYTGPGDHGFDGEWDLETPWLKKGLERVTSEWLG